MNWSISGITKYARGGCLLVEFTRHFFVEITFLDVSNDFKTCTRICKKKIIIIIYIIYVKIRLNVN